MSGGGLSRDDVEAILRLVESAEHLSDFHLKYGDLELHVSRAPDGAGAAASPSPAESPGPVAQMPASAPESTFRPAGGPPPVPAGMAVVKSPMVGTFYRAPSPGAAPFVEVGNTVDADAVVCIIEVMKLMNSVHAGTAGIVREIRVDDGQPVEFGQILLVLEPR